jgi:hypothetical protein
MDYWEKLAELQAGDSIERTIAGIAEDIRDRRGIGNELEQIDDQTVVGMLESWVAIARATI